MVDVLIALAPTLIFAFAVYHIYAISTYFISLFCMIGSEFVYVGLKNNTWFAIRKVDGLVAYLESKGLTKFKAIKVNKKK